MRSNIFKYIFIIFIVAIIAYSIYVIYYKDKTQENTEVEQKVEEVAVEKTDLRLGISNFDTLNPLVSNNKEVLNIDKFIFEPLLNLTSDYRLENCLATECSRTSDTTYVVKIDNDKRWHNGVALIASDIQFTIDRLKEGRSVYSYNVEKVSSVEVLDNSTIKIVLSEPVPFFEYNLTFPILPSNYYFDEDFYTTEKVPMGTGMYEIKSIDSNNIVLEKNTSWWNISNVNPKIETINIKIFTEIGELYNSFKLGNIDIFTTENYDLENYIGTIGYIKNEFKGRYFDYLALNCQQDVLQYVEVRQAIAYSIDKSNIVSTVFANNYYTSNSPLDYGNWLYEENDKILTYNQDQAKRILLENGWEYKNNRWQKTENYRTKRLNLSLTVNKDNATRLAVAENIKAQLEQVGITVTLKKVSASSYNTILQNKNYEMLITGVYNSYSPNVETFFGDNNLENYTNEEVTSILNEVKKTNDNNKLKDKYSRLLDIYNNDLPFISLYRNKSIVVKNQNLAGEITPNNFFSYYNINTWARY